MDGDQHPPVLNYSDEPPGGRLVVEFRHESVRILLPKQTFGRAFRTHRNLALVYSLMTILLFVILILPRLSMNDLRPRNWIWALSEENQVRFFLVLVPAGCCLGVSLESWREVEL